jgi:hypothetical protein
MKKVVTIVIVIILIVIGYVVWNRPATDSVTNTPAETQSGSNDTKDTGGSRDAYAPVTKDTTDTSLLGRLKTASVSAGDTGSRVTLVKGAGQFSVDDVKGTVSLGDVAIAKSAGGTNYALATLAVNSGGSGTFWYVVLFQDKDGVLTDVSYSLVGDRVKVTGIRADEVSDAGKPALAVSVSYLDHDKGEPLASAPTVPHTKILFVSNGIFDGAKEITI